MHMMAGFPGLASAPNIVRGAKVRATSFPKPGKSQDRSASVGGHFVFNTEIAETQAGARR